MCMLHKVRRKNPLTKNWNKIQTSTQTIFLHFFLKPECFFVETSYLISPPPMSEFSNLFDELRKKDNFWQRLKTKIFDLRVTLALG